MMKQKHLLLACLMAVFMVFGIFAVASAYELSLQATSDGVTVQSQFGRGDDVYLNILLDDPTDVAGCAFTLNYPVAVLDAPVTTAEGTSDDITSSFPFSFTDGSETTDTHRENSSEAGKIYFSGAAINGTTGGAIYDTSGEITIFTVKFTVKSDAPFGNSQVSLSQTELLNADAGWGSGSTPEPVPVLVGAKAQGTPEWNTPELTDDFFTISASFASPLDLTVFEDSDGDEMPDWWEEQIVNADPNDPIESINDVLPGDDFDGDGYSNLTEYLNGWDPTDPNDPGCIDMDLVAGWNLISLPVIPDDASLAVLFPDAEVAYGFDGSYFVATILEPCKGYWVKVPADATYTICGQPFTCTVTLSAGWHLMGAVNCTTTPVTAPPGAIDVMYGFSGSYYVASEFEAGKGYWVKVNQECEFTLDCP